ncbi:MAG: sigma-70 family RNA polymerase sigma factor [Planctomycetota bacterium]
MRELDNSTLVKEIVAGRTECFAEVVRRHDDAVRRIVARQISDPDTVEELVQRTFYFAFRRLAQLSEPERLGAWLGTIARNNVIEHHRRSSLRERALELTQVEAVSRNRSADWIWGEVEQLPHDLREVLLLRYQMNCSYAEIADRLGVKVSTVRGRIYEGRKALRRRLLD